MLISQSCLRARTSLISPSRRVPHHSSRFLSLLSTQTYIAGKAIYITGPDITFNSLSLHKLRLPRFFRLSLVKLHFASTHNHSHKVKAIGTADHLPLWYRHLTAPISLNDLELKFWMFMLFSYSGHFCLLLTILSGSLQADKLIVHLVFSYQSYFTFSLRIRQSLRQRKV